MTLPSEKDFENYTQADEDKALKQFQASASVDKHMVRGRTYFARMGDGQIIPITLQLSMRDYEQLAGASNNDKAGLALMNRLAKRGGYQHDLADMPLQELTSLITDYIKVVNKTMGVDMGKSSDSAPSSKADQDAQ